MKDRDSDIQNLRVPSPWVLFKTMGTMFKSPCPLVDVL